MKKALFELIALLGIVVAYLLLAAMYAWQTPKWQVPDEPAHYNYVQQLAETGRYPIIDAGDWNQPYQNMLTGCGFHPAVLQPDPSLVQINTPYLEACGYDITMVAGISRIEYEDHQPPLYYTLQAVVYLLTDGDLLAMRLFSVLLGSGAIIAAWGITRRLFPNEQWLAIVTAGIVAFIPQRLFMMSGVNNDALAEALGGLLLLLTTYYITATNVDWRWALAMGFVAGLIFLTKTTVYYTAGIAFIAIILRCWQDKAPFRAIISQLLAFSILAVAIGSIWWIHSLDVYGNTDFLGLQRHDQVVEGQLRTETYIERDLRGSTRLYLENLARTTFQSFWGQLGWMAYPMQPRIYNLLMGLTVLLLIGSILYAVQEHWPKSLDKAQRHMLALLGVSLLLVIAQFLFYNLTFVQFQGRYLYPALIPIALMFALGADAWRKIIFKDSKMGWLSVWVVLAIALLAIYVLREVIPIMPRWN